MSGINAAAPDPAQELGAEDEVTAFNNEEEDEYEGDESLNDIKSELQLEADSDKAKVRACVRACSLGPPLCCTAPVQLISPTVTSSVYFHYRRLLYPNKLLLVSC